MFTGLIREIGVVKSLARRRGVVVVRITAPATAAGVGVGDSVAVQGICLTVTAVGRGAFSVEAAAETRRLTTLGRWRRGQRVHLEPALRAGDPLDGHLMQGHIDGTGRVIARRSVSGGGQRLTVALQPDLAAYLTPKGSVAVDGVSLTVDAGPFLDSFSVNLIPHTLQDTCFDALRRGDRVNLEMDVLVKAVRGGAGQGWPALEPAHEESSTDTDKRQLTVQRLRRLGFGRPRGKGNT